MPVTRWPCVNELFDLNKLGQGSHNTYFMPIFLKSDLRFFRRSFFSFWIYMYMENESPILAGGL